MNNVISRRRAHITTRERGAGSVLTAAVCVVVVVVICVVVWQMLWLHDARRVRQSADLVALAAAHGHVDGKKACQVASEQAASSTVELESCELDAGYGEFIVTACVTKQIEPAIAGYQPTSRACAKAGVIRD